MITLLIDSELHYPLDDTILAQLLDEVGVDPGPAGLETMIERWMKTSAVVWLPLADGGRVAVSWRAVRTAQVLQVVPGEVVGYANTWQRGVVSPGLLPVDDDPDDELLRGRGGAQTLTNPGRVMITVAETDGQAVPIDPVAIWRHLGITGPGTGPVRA